MLNGEDLRRRPYVERKAALRKILRHDKLLAAACKLGLEGIVSKKLDAPYKSGPSEAWLKIKNPNAPAATPIAKIGTKQIVRRATKRMAASRM